MSSSGGYSLMTQVRASVPMIKALRREIMILLIVLLAGLIIGLLIGWATVQWTDAAPVHLRSQDFRPFHLRLLSMAYQNGSISAQEMVAQGIGRQWTNDILKADVDQLIANDPANASRYQAVLSAVETERASTAGTEPSGTTPAATDSGPNLLLLIGLVALLVIAGVGIGLVRRASQSAQAQAIGGLGSAAPKTPAKGPAVRAPVAAAWAEEAEPPLKQYDLVYLLGDDRFDMSNPIETEQGTFLGECGMGIGETIGVGEPDKVTAFEVWLFDKNDIRTVTTVLMSQHAFHDGTLRAKLAPKGEAALAEPGAVVTLTTASLRVRAKVVEMEYGAGGLPDQSFFKKLHVVMAAWPVGDSGVTQPAPPTF